MPSRRYHFHLCWPALLPELTLNSTAVATTIVSYAYREPCATGQSKRFATYPASLVHKQCWALLGRRIHGYLSGSMVKVGPYVMVISCN